MSNLMRDPKGYYSALGIDDSADADAVKSAYRTKAKRLHPDFNRSPIAAKQFHRLHEAYEILSDPAKRAAYDRPWRKEPPQGDGLGDAGVGAYARRESSKRADTDAPGPRTQEARPSKPEAMAASAVEQPAICKCGKVTAQPRYVIFDLVWGRLNKVQRRGISGVYCRSCADRTAVRASLLTWLAGWWAWPNGPKETVKALINNIRGGRKPPERNARLLMRQARALKARGEMELSRSAAEQAIAFAATPLLRREVDSLLLSLSAHGARPLKDRWAKPGWAATVQVLPLAIFVGMLSMSITLLSPISLTLAVRDFFRGEERAFPEPELPAKDLPSQPLAAPALNTGRVYSVVAPQANLRTGPGANYQLSALLRQGTVVLVTETDPTGTWLRVTTPDGATGFVAGSQLSPDVHLDALEDLGDLGRQAPKGPPPASDAVKTP